MAGRSIDPPGQIEAYLEAIVPTASPFVESGPADQEGTPIGTIPRLKAALAAIGYQASVTSARDGAGVRLTVDVVPYDRVRNIFVSGNWPIRQDQIQKRISVRPGQALPPAGPERDAALERERTRLVAFLRDEGYLDANAHIKMHAHGAVPATLDLDIFIDLGPAYPVGTVRTVGNTVFSASEIADIFQHGRDWWSPIRTGMYRHPVPFNQKSLREDVQRLVRKYREKGYPGARVTTDYNPTSSVDRAAKVVNLAIFVSEHKRVTVDFEGNRSQSTKALLEEVTLFEAGAYDDHELDSSADAIQHWYQEKGHLLARVHWRRERLSDVSDRVVFVIEEGPELRVRRVEFVGNAALPSAELADVVTVKPFPFLGVIGLGAGGYLTGRQLERDVERLVDHYRRAGYPEATASVSSATNTASLELPGAIAAAAETTARSDRGVFVRFTVSEGPRVTVAAIRFRTVGPPLPRDDAYLLRTLRLDRGDPLDPDLLRDDGARLRRLLGDDGYPEAVVTVDIERRGTEADVIWTLEPGPLTRVGPVFVRGNSLTKTRTIMEQVPLQTGVPYSTTGFERGSRNVQLLQLFNSFKISFPPVPRGDRKVVDAPMLIEVEERHDNLGTVKIGGGAATEQALPGSALPFGLYASLGYEHRNLLGRAWTATFVANLGTNLARANGLFTDRRFFGSQFRLELGANYLSQATVRLGAIRTGGGTIGFARQMAPGVDVALRYNLRDTSHTEDLLRTAGPDESQPTVQLDTIVGSLALTAEWLRFDNRFLPTRGFRLDGSLEVANPALSFGIGSDAFLKMGVHSTVVIPVLPWLSIRHGFRYDQGFPLGGASLLPKVERYFAGGDTTLRGFELDRARQEVVTGIVGPVSLVQYRPLGGSLRIISNLDFQFPIAPPWYGSVFLDDGVLADSLIGLDLRAFRHSVGIAPLVIKLPVGDIAIGWGYPIDQSPGDNHIGRLLVNIGLMF